jgi:hypothetical protein
MYHITKFNILYIIYINSQNRQSILLEKHALSLTKKLYDVTFGNLLGYNKKVFLSDNFDLPTVSQSQTNSFSSPGGKPPSLFYGLFACVYIQP